MSHVVSIIFNSHTGTPYNLRLLVQDMCVSSTRSCKPWSLYVGHRTIETQRVFGSVLLSFFPGGWDLRGLKVRLYKLYMYVFTIYIYIYVILSNMLVDVCACIALRCGFVSRSWTSRTFQNTAELNGRFGRSWMCPKMAFFCFGLVIFPLLTIPRHIFQSLCCSIARHPVCCWSMLVRMDADGLLLVPLVTSTCSMALSYHPWKLTAKAPEHQWLEDDWFLFWGPVYFQGVR